MIAVYLDTNVILSKWAQNYPFHNGSIKIIKAIEIQDIIGYFSAFEPMLPGSAGIIKLEFGHATINIKSSIIAFRI